MLNLHERFICDSQNHIREVIIDYATYQKLLQILKEGDNKTEFEGKHRKSRSLFGSLPTSENIPEEVFYSAKHLWEKEWSAGGDKM